MTQSITPHWSDLEKKTDDELREILSELNNASLRKLTRETILAMQSNNKHIQYQSEEITALNNKLKMIKTTIDKAFDEDNSL